MGFTKNKGLSVIIALIILVVFSIMAFLLPVKHSVLFWLGYSFTIYATLFLLAIILITLNKPSLNDKFHGLPIVNLAWTYFIIQLVLSIWQITGFEAPYTYAIIANTTLAAIFIILTILTYAAGTEILRIEKKVDEKIFFIQNLQTDIELLSSNDKNLSKALKNLSETVRFSDPMSHSQLSAVENIIIEKTDLLQKTIANVDISLTLCDEIQKLFAERNKKCKILKNFPEPKPQTDNSGIKIAALGFGVVNILIVFALVLYFVIIPTAKYNDAITLFNNGEYEQAIEAFESLGNFKESKFKINEAEEALKEEKYALAEDCYKKQEYIEAIKIFNSLDGYKDSKDKIEHIYNMFSSGNKVYFGMYEGAPISWQVLHTESDKMLLITENCVEKLAFNNELKNISWENSSIRDWLNNDFIKEFSDSQKDRLLPTLSSELNDNVFLLSEEEYNEYSEILHSESDYDWWLRTKTDSGMMYVYRKDGSINSTGEGVVHVMGVRPCVWVTLK